MTYEDIHFALREVNAGDAQFLFELLRDRPPEVNISHRAMPTIDEHMAFVRSRPYHAWYVMEYGKKRVGSIYLTHAHEIGIHVQPGFQRQGLGLRAVKALMVKHQMDRFLANVAPANDASNCLFQRLGFKHIQNTYELRHEH